MNLAPYSYFQAVADNPDVVMFSAAAELAVEGGKLQFGVGRKHSETNAGIGGEFVCNLVSFDLREAMNQTSAHLPGETSEADQAGLDMVPSKRVKPTSGGSPGGFGMRGG